MENEEKIQKHIVRSYFHNLLDMRSDMLSYEDLHDMMKENIIIHGANMWILMMAILIASIGLNVNSTAVIIGAMLVSPLMGGILTMGYSLAIRDLGLLKQAGACFLTQMVISLITSTAYFTLTPLTTATSEMIARTSPTLWDVLIALFGGIAGSIGNTRKKASNVIPGVAIATALMPPLCTTGYGIATGQFSFAMGAFYLFTINTLFIGLSAFIVTKLLRVPSVREMDEKRRRRANRIVTVLIIIIIIPSALTGALTVYKSILDKNISDYLNKEFVFENTQLVQNSVDNANRKISVSLVGEHLSDERISELQDRLAEYNLSSYTLHVTQDEVNTDSEQVTIAVQQNTIQDLEKQLKEQKAENAELSENLNKETDYAALSEKTAAVFTKLTDVRCGLMAGEKGNVLLLKASVSGELSEEETETIKNFLKAESGVEDVELEIGE